MISVVCPLLVEADVAARSQGRAHMSANSALRLVEVFELAQAGHDRSWPKGEEPVSSAYGGVADGFERRATAPYDPLPTFSRG